jgi:hypothetical protein
MRISRRMLWALALLALASFIASVMLIRPIDNGSDLHLYLFFTIWLSVGALIVATMCMDGYERGKARPLMRIGLAASSLAPIASIGFFIERYNRENFGDNMLAAPLWLPGIVSTLWIIAGYAGVAALMLLMPTAGLAARLRMIVLSLAALAGFYASAMILAYPWLVLDARSNEQFLITHVSRVAQILIVTAFIAFLSLAAHSIRVMRVGTQALRPRRPVKLTCPRCGATQQLHTEGDQCAHCRLRIRVSIS